MFDWQAGTSDWLNCIGMKHTESGKRKSSANATWTEIMKRRKAVSPHFAVCLKNAGYPASLELHKIYRVLPDKDAAEEGDLRVVDESGEDYLYPAEWFSAIDLPRRLRTSLLRRSARLQSA